MSKSMSYCVKVLSDTVTSNFPYTSLPLTDVSKTVTLTFWANIFKFSVSAVCICMFFSGAGALIFILSIESFAADVSLPKICKIF